MPSTFFYNDSIKTLIVVQAKGDVELYREQDKNPNGEWLLDEYSSQECEEKIGLLLQGMHLAEHMLSPHGYYVLVCTNGLKVYKFERKLEGEGKEKRDKIVLVETEWEIPSKIDDFEPVELARRVRFEARNIIRILTKDNRDIMYQLVQDRPVARYLGEFKVWNHFHIEGHKLSAYEPDSPFGEFFMRNRLYRASHWHRVNFIDNGDADGDAVMDAEVNDINMITPVIRNHGKFEAQLAFNIFDWFLGEKIASKETSVELLPDVHKLQLTLSIYPQQLTLMHLIIQKTNKEDQSYQAAQLKTIFECADQYENPDVTGLEINTQFKVPMIANRYKKRPYQMMNDLGLRALADTLMGYIGFQNLNNYQEDVSRMLENEAPNLMKCIETSLQVTPTSALIESIDLPIHAQLITFRSDSATLNQ